MPLRSCFLFVTTVVITLLAVTHHSFAERQPTQAPHKIGVLLCLTGDCAEWGMNSLRGAQLAVEKINSAGGIDGRNLELVVQDSQDTSPANAVAAFNKLLLDSDIKLFLGPTWTVAGMPLAPMVARNKNIVITSPSVGVRDFNESASNVLNIWPHDERATRRLARFAREQGHTKAAIFGSEDPWVQTQSNTFEEEFEQLGGSITNRVEPLPGNRSLKAEALKVCNSKPDVVFFSNYQADVFAKELDILKCELPKLSILMEKERVKSAQGALDGTVFALYEAPSRDFKREFYKKFSAEPGITADTAFDAVTLYGKAIAEVGDTDAKKITEHLLSIKDYQGASGRFSIDRRGAVNKQPVLWKVQGLEYQAIKDERR